MVIIVKVEVVDVCVNEVNEVFFFFFLTDSKLLKSPHLSSSELGWSSPLRKEPGRLDEPLMASKAAATRCCCF